MRCFSINYLFALILLILYSNSKISFLSFFISFSFLSLSSLFVVAENQDNILLRFCRWCHFSSNSDFRLFKISFSEQNFFVFTHNVMLITVSNIYQSGII